MMAASPQPDTGPPPDRGPNERRSNNVVITNPENVRFIAIKAKNEDTNICKLGPFAISKFIEFIVQSTGSVDTSKSSRSPGTPTPLTAPHMITYTTQYKSGKILIKTTNDKQTSQLLNAKKFGEIDIETSIPLGPNTS